MKLFLIINPKAGSGRAPRQVARIERCLAANGIRYEVAYTERQHHGSLLARAAADKGFDVVGVVGGDGTLNEIVQAYLGPAGEPLDGPNLALIPAGTGGDFRKTLELPTSVQGAISRLCDGAPRPFDLGIAEVRDSSGNKCLRAFVNILSFGVSGRTSQLMHNGPKWLGGRTAFWLSAVRATLTYRNVPVDLHVDGEPYLRCPFYEVAICNGRFFGGGMMIAPDADPADGLFDVVTIGDITRAQGIGLTRYIYQGRHLYRPRIRIRRGRVVEATPLSKHEEVLVDLDGETPGRLPLTARIAQGALRIHT